MSEPIMVKGYTGAIEFDGTFITIHRTGMRARLTVGKGDKRIPISALQGTQWRPAGGLTNGFLQLVISGSSETKSQFGSQAMSAVNDENSVMFTRKQEAEFAHLRQVLDQALAARIAGHGAQPAQPDVTDQLAKLAQLRDSGVVTPEEFEAKKTELLGRL
ncbi:DUF4429 domain-containing protein [Tersicoccus sp. MR15.9]|uniref:DUF4429 domain-containing protein n=1 Tax=Tersicoccus mangrovi TaxID=3121635 RepID=UPI002FE5C212